MDETAEEIRCHVSSNSKTLTTSEVEGWRSTFGEHWCAKIGPLGNEVVIDGDRILATARELEKARARVVDLESSEIDLECDAAYLRSGLSEIIKDLHDARRLEPSDTPIWSAINAVLVSLRDLRES